jgi:hypothetical protein
MNIDANCRFQEVCMSSLIDKPKRALIRSRDVLGGFLDFVGPSTRFEFQVNQSLDTCAGLLKSRDQHDFVQWLLSTTTRVEITWEDSATYRFSIRKIRGRETPIIATGSLIAIADDLTLVSGKAIDNNWFLIVCFLGAIAFFVVTQMPGVPLFLALLALCAFINFLVSADQRRSYIDFVADALTGYEIKPKRT